MGQGSLIDNSEYHVCDSCDAEFTVTPAYEDDIDIMFCPFCGSPLDVDDVDFDEEDELDDEDNRD